MQHTAPVDRCEVLKIEDNCECRDVVESYMKIHPLSSKGNDGGNRQICVNDVILTVLQMKGAYNPLKPELNTSAQHCLTRFFTGNFVS
jgi:hypothetical protein